MYKSSTKNTAEPVSDSNSVHVDGNKDLWPFPPKSLFWGKVWLKTLNFYYGCIVWGQRCAGEGPCALGWERVGMRSLDLSQDALLCPGACFTVPWYLLRYSASFMGPWKQRTLALISTKEQNHAQCSVGRGRPGCLGSSTTSSGASCLSLGKVQHYVPCCHRLKNESIISAYFVEFYEAEAI